MNVVRRALGATAVAVVALTAAAAGLRTASAFAVDVHPENSDAPSILLVVTDDQRWDTLWSMPNVQRHLVDRGVTFTNAFVTNPLCCPSRATIFTGNHSHTTGVYRQNPPFGGFGSFNDVSTLATWLDAGGYTTAMFGKYIDAYQSHALSGYVPPGWDRWEAFVHASYYDYGLTKDGEIERYGSAPHEYATGVLGRDAEAFIRSTPGPIFVEYAPPAPHDPAPFEARFDGAFTDLEPWRPPNYDEPDVSDKPAHVRAFRPLTEEQRSYIDELRRNQYRALQSVDEQVGQLVEALEDTGRLENTLIVYTSDNGLMWGEHRWMRKEVPYDEAIRVPMVVRFDRMLAGPAEDDHLVLNLDVAPTIADAADVVHPLTEGVSLLRLVEDPLAEWRTEFLVEHMEGANPVPTYCAMRSADHLYVRYATGERELYDLNADPYELDNIVRDPASADLITVMSSRLAELCDPPPPGLADVPGDGWAIAALSAAAAVLGLWGRTRSRLVQPGR